MRKLFLTIMVTSIFAFGHDMPICEEFEHEKNVFCWTTPQFGLILTVHNDSSKTYELYKNNRKIYIEYSKNAVLASNGKIITKVQPIPAENKEKYINDIFALMFRDF